MVHLQLGGGGGGGGAVDAEGFGRRSERASLRSRSTLNCKVGEAVERERGSREVGMVKKRAGFMVEMVEISCSLEEKRKLQIVCYFYWLGSLALLSRRDFW
jgi:hypothetical protein